MTTTALPPSNAPRETSKLDTISGYRDQALASDRDDPAGSFRSMLKLSLLFALIKLLMQAGDNLLQAHLGWGYFTDEAYYILCGERLDWGYVDHGPIIALQARLAVLLFGKSLLGIRLLASTAGAVKLLLTGIMAWQLGAERRGQMMALAAVLLSAQFIALDSFLSMNSFEPVFWMTALIAMLQIVKSGNLPWWVLLGVASGIGCENKPSMVFMLGALLMGLMMTGERRVLRSKGFLLAVTLTVALASPYLLWQMSHGWATYHFLHNETASRRSSIRMFLPLQVLLLGFVSVPMVAAGLLWLLKAKSAVRFRFLGWTYLFFLFLMMSLRSKDYYLSPIYPMLFAAGGVAFERYMATHRRSWLVPVCLVQMFTFELMCLPLIMPTVSPDQWLRIAALKNLGRPGHTGSHFTQFYALRFGWQELTDDVTRIYRSLPAAERAQAGIICVDWNTASAINFLSEGTGLPFAISSHNNFFLWGPHGETGAVMIVVTRQTRDELLNEYDRVEKVGSMHDPYALDWHAGIYLCHGRKRPFSEDWQSLKHYD